MEFWLAAKLLLLLFVANGAPILARNLLKSRCDAPIDAHHNWRDGRPWLGPSKTWRGLIAAVLCTTLVAPLLQLPMLLGLAVAGLSMLGDLFSSFTKRRLGVPSSGMAFALDQIPEALLPLAVIGSYLGISWLTIITFTVSFLILELLISRVLYNLNIRKQPY